MSEKDVPAWWLHLRGAVLAGFVISGSLTLGFVIGDHHLAAIQCGIIVLLLMQRISE